MAVKLQRSPGMGTFYTVHLHFGKNTKEQKQYTYYCSYPDVSAVPSMTIFLFLPLKLLDFLQGTTMPRVWIFLTYLETGVVIKLTVKMSEYKHWNWALLFNLHFILD